MRNDVAEQIASAMQRIRMTARSTAYKRNSLARCAEHLPYRRGDAPDPAWPVSHLHALR